MKDLIILGAGGFGREVAWVVERINKAEPTWNLLGFLDDNEELQGKEINGQRILGRVDDALSYPDAYYVCAIGSSDMRNKIIERIRTLLPNVKFGTIIDPSVEMSRFNAIGEGTILCAHVIITVNVVIGDHVIVNLNCTIGHDAKIDDFATLFPSVNISGMAKIGHHSELGTGAMIIQGRNVGSNSVVGAGAVIIKDIPDQCTAVGCPATPIKFNY